MGARVLDGKAVSARVLAGLGPRVAALSRRGIAPRLDIVRVGEDPASRAYVAGKARACRELGIAGEVHVLPEAIAVEGLFDLVDRLNDDPGVHGVLVQLPLPPHIEPALVAARIVPAKDVDGLHPFNLGALLRGDRGLTPCTPAGIMRLLDASGTNPRGRHAVVLGRSDIVGKPVAMMLLARDATVTMCHSRTPDVGSYSRSADILVVATGRPGLVGGDMIKPGAVVIDVGISRTQDGKLVGDVDFASARDVAGWLTPVPGGVGPMTVAMLLENTVRACETICRLST